MRDPPRQRHLRAALAILLANLHERRVIDQLAHVLPGAVDLVLVAKGRVLRHVDAVLRVEVHEARLLQVRVQLDLVRGGDDGGLVEEARDFGVGEVGDADGAGLRGRLEDALHGFVRIDVVRVAGLHLAVDFGHRRGAAGEGARPVHEVEVHVVGAEVGEGGVQSGFDVVGVVAVVPELGGDEELVAWDARFADCIANGGFGAISGPFYQLNDPW